MKLTLALSKGRIFEETAEILSKIGIRPLEDPEKEEIPQVTTHGTDHEERSEAGLYGEEQCDADQEDHADAVLDPEEC